MAKRVGALSMLKNGFKVVLMSLPLMLPVVLVNGLLFGWLDHQLGKFIMMLQETPKTAQFTGQIFGVLSLLLFCYGALQFSKRHTASRISWIPVLFLPSSVFVTICAGSYTGAHSQEEVILSMGLRIALELIWMCTVGGLVYGLWVSLSYTVARSGRVQTSEAFSILKRAGLGFLAPHGGATMLIYLGMQVVLPGLYYAVIYSFVDHVAVIHPERRSFKWSTFVSRGRRRGIVFLFLSTLFPAMILRFYLMVNIEGLLHGWGVSSVFSIGGTTGFDSTAAWNNVGMMPFGAVWNGSFISEGLAMGISSLLIGISACGLTWAYIESTNAVSDDADETTSDNAVDKA